jgi:hypothetical protein
MNWLFRNKICEREFALIYYPCTYDSRFIKTNESLFYFYILGFLFVIINVLGFLFNNYNLLVKIITGFDSFQLNFSFFKLFMFYVWVQEFSISSTRI